MKKIIIATLLLFPLIANAVNTIDVKPIESRQLPKPERVKSGPYDFPIITWGGDIATILANGNTKITANNSIFKNNGLSFKLKREDIFENQLKHYISGDTPYLRGTMSMINMAASAVRSNENLTPVVFYQLTWSAGGDALVVKPGIKRASDLCGKTIALNYDGPHLNYANKVLSDAGCNIADNHIVWTKDLTGTKETPMEAFRANNVDAAFVIIPDALAITSGGTVGSGSEDSVKGATILLSTKTANRVIADVYAVRKDYYDQHESEVEKVAASLFKAQEQLQQLMSSKNTEYQKLVSSTAQLLLDSSDAIADTEGLLADAQISGFSQNVQFFQNKNNFRNFEQIVKESAEGIKALGVINQAGKVLKAELNYALLANAVTSSNAIESTKFDSQKIARVVDRKQKQDSLNDATIFEFEVYFKANQKAFNASLYEDQFRRVMEMSKTYGGAVITIEGHSDPMGYLKQKKAGESPFILNQIKQSAKNLSMTRAQQVRDAIISFSANKNVTLDASQFATIGHGISSPRTGICGSDPCAPKTEQEWLSNMRVVFRIIQIEAEEDVFSPL